jgi:hypothetical protein
LIAKIGLLSYVIIQLIKVFDHENNYQRSIWSNDIVIDPSQIEIDYDQISFATTYFLERDDADDFGDLSKYFRF